MQIFYKTKVPIDKQKRSKIKQIFTLNHSGEL